MLKGIPQIIINSINLSENGEDQLSNDVEYNEGDSNSNTPLIFKDKISAFVTQNGQGHDLNL